jgi:hypothetical protein
MKTLALACTTLLAVALMPSVASADRYDRGDRYRGHRGGHSYRHHDHDRSSFSFSFGFGSSGYRDYSHVGFGYSRGYGHYHRPYYRPAPVVVERYYAPPPVVYYPARTYYYDGYYRPSYSYYRDGYCR